MIDWHIRAASFSSCNCDHWCPCQFEGDPTPGFCEAFEAFRVDEGYFGDVDLAGVVAATVYSYPGPVYEGGGKMQTFVDENASPEQVDAIVRLLHGEETHEAATSWWVFHAMCDTVLETRVAPIHLEMDINERTARTEIPGVLESTGEPIRNPHDGGKHRVQIRHPEGIEFEYAEIGNARTSASGDIPLDFDNTYAQFNMVDFKPTGPAHTRKD